MTKEELLSELDKISGDLQRETREVKEKYYQIKKDVLFIWAQENATFHVGDMIEYEDKTRAILIEKVYGECGYNEPYVVYFGPLLNKKHEIMKGPSAGYFTMYEPHNCYKLQKIDPKK